MPVKSFSSSVIKWPNEKLVISSLKKWTNTILKMNQNVVRIGYFGSYVRGDWGVGSDLDLVIILSQSDLPFERRNLGWQEHQLPVPTDILIYTQQEWEAMRKEEMPFFKRMNSEIKWIYMENTNSKNHHK
mgnify:CR=1 FL=1